MARKRKDAQKEKDIPLARPPASDEETEDIPEDEQWRLIEKSGVLNHIQRNDASKSPDVAPNAAPGYERGDFSDEVFNSILYIIPFAFVYLMMDIMVHQQYGKHLTIPQAFLGMARPLPFLSLFIFYTIRHKPHRIAQTLLFFVSTGCGIRLIWVVNREPWTIVMQQCPPLGTLWIYSVVQLNLLPTVISLGLVAWGVKLLHLKIIF
ncbi:hypothetical protein BOTBODRAFT_59970 [Botryobasidium botryosum FD-172 SS1]|uniref:DUF7719 domain-containing protein n=1 Tax=Botryobasidium botryosum (strain FD-172 SS1) TaxID=930990 RepID=A0A067LYM4_BOTB1|nr:hypothetical protein BOTBODRAFT_59970 [Botryobasidium botryosum FD-172 SS1]